MKDIKEMLGELTDEELQDAKCFIESELVVRFDSKVAEKAQKLANMIQQIVDLDCTLQSGSINNVAGPVYFLETNEGTCRYRIIPDYHEYDECGMSYGYIISKWNDKKNIWEDMTHKCLTFIK